MSRFTPVDLEPTMNQLEEMVVSLEALPRPNAPRAHVGALRRYLKLIRWDGDNHRYSTEKHLERLGVIRRAACSIYTTMGPEAFILVSFTVSISTFCTKKVIEAFVPAYRVWWQGREMRPSLRTMTCKLRLKFDLDALFYDCQLQVNLAALREDAESTDNNGKIMRPTNERGIMTTLLTGRKETRLQPGRRRRDARRAALINSRPGRMAATVRS